MIGTEIIIDTSANHFDEGVDGEYAPPRSLVDAIEEECWSVVRRNVSLQELEASSVLRLYGTKTSAPALHALCKKKRLPLDVLVMFLDIYPAATRITDSCFQVLPIHIACRSGLSIDWIDRLLQAYPESIGIPDDGGNLPIHLACSFGSMELIHHLVHRCSENFLETRNKKQQTALHLACSRNDTTKTVVKQLLESCRAGRVCEIPDWQGQAPLHKAVMWKVDSSVIELLLEAHPASARYADQHGMTPYDICRKLKTDDSTLIKLLREHQRKSGARIARIRDSVRFKLEAVGDAVPKRRRAGVKLPRDPPNMYSYEQISKC